MFKSMLLTLLLALPCMAEGITRQVRFAPGTDSATLEGAVLRGDRDTYTLEAGEGQKIWIKITSVEDNAVFDLYSPGGELFEQEARSMNGRLPESGAYKVVVGGTRGNASYRLKVTIK